MAEEGGLTRDQIRHIGEFIERGLRITRARMRELGMHDDALLDPDESIDEQVAILRSLYLEAEKSALPFNSRDNHFWRVLRARLQPVVLAYATHARFMQSLGRDLDDLPPAGMLDIYRERLENSSRFRQLFFELSEKLNQESGVGGSARPAPASAKTSAHEPHISAVSESAAIQGNVLKTLERQLREMEKAFNRQEEISRKAQQEILLLNDVIQEKSAQIASLERKNVQLDEKNSALRLSLDAAERSQQTNQPVESSGSSAPLSSVLAVERLANAGQQELLLKIEAMERELASTSDAAYNAFMASSDLGIVILFMLSSFKCHSLEQLASEMARSIATFGVKAVVGVRMGTSMHYVASTGADIALQSVLEANKGRGALVEGNQLMLFDANCCVLVQEPPMQDADRYDRLKDNLGTLLRGAAARHESIEASLAVLRQQTQVEQLILRSHEVFQNFEKNIARQQDKIARVTGLFAQDLRKALSIPAGDPNSIKLNMELKKVEDSLRGLFKSAELIDPAFTKNIGRVAQGIQGKQKGGES